MEHFFRYMIVLATFFAGETGLAQMSCSQVFKEGGAHSSYQLERSLVQEFEAVKRDYSQTDILSEANLNIHALAVLSNKILDRAVSYIIKVNSPGVDPAVVARDSHVAEKLLEKLQQTFSIGDNSMKAAVSYRVESEIAEMRARYEDYQQKRAIGFGRDQSAESFHAEVSPKRPIGFGGEFKGESAEAVAFEAQLESSIKKIVEYYEEVRAPEKEPVGFTPSADNTQKQMTYGGPVGFMLHKARTEKISEDRLHKIGFDVENGVFEFLKAQP